MLSTVLVENPWLIPVGLLVLLLAGPAAGALLVSRPRLTACLLFVAVLAVAVLTLTPTVREMTRTCTIEWSWPVLGAVETAANLILFVPITLLAGVLTRRPWLTVLVTSGASALVEAGQALAPALGRSCSTNDWWFNTLGAVLGALLALVALALHRRRSRAGQSD